MDDLTLEGTNTNNNVRIKEGSVFRDDSNRQTYEFKPILIADKYTIKAYFGIIKVNVFIYDDFFTTSFDSDDIP